MFVALLEPELRADYLGWAKRLTDPAEPFDQSELEILRHSCHDRLTELAAAVAQDEPLPRWVTGVSARSCPPLPA